MDLSKIFKIADELDALSKEAPTELLDSLEEAANKAGKAWSGSWIGYHSKVYYADLQPIPPGARFSKEWGFMDTFPSTETYGNWSEYNFDNLVIKIKRMADIEDIKPFNKKAKEVSECFEEYHSELLSLLTPIMSNNESDSFLKDLLDKIRNEKIYSYVNYVDFLRPQDQGWSRDSNAVTAGLQVPPHFSVLAEMSAIRGTYSACSNLAKMARRAGSHLENIDNKEAESERIGTNVFIGHGRSFMWRDLKDFIQDRLHLPWDEFNRLPVAGFTNITRLSQMLDSAAVAFIIMTAEDEQADGKLHARMNVIHEAGLFQGRLGFERAILLLEEGCEEFSNVQGLGQIRFPAGNISAVFEKIRKVLEREGLVL